MRPADSTRLLRWTWTASLVAAMASPLLLVRLFPGGVHDWKFVLVFTVMAASLHLFAVTHAILMHRDWRLSAGSGALRKAKRVLYWLLTPTMVVGFLGFLITLSSMLFR